MPRSLPKKRSPGRRRAVLEAALACFAERGFAATTLAEIRKRSGASTGSIYHHFESKERLGATLYVEGLRDYQAGLLAELAKHDDAERGVKAIVAHHLGWVAKHPEWARYLFAMRTTECVAAAEAEIGERNVGFLRALRAWFAPHVESGAVTKLPADVFIAVLVGPSQELARHWLAGRSRTPIKDAARLLAEAAWQSVRGTARRGLGP